MRSGPIQFGSAPPGIYITSEDAKRLLKDVDSGQVREILYLLAGPDPERHTPDFDLVEMYTWGYCKVSPFPEKKAPAPETSEQTSLYPVRVGEEMWYATYPGKTHQYSIVRYAGKDVVAPVAACGVERKKIARKANDQSAPTCLRCRKLLGFDEKTGLGKVYRAGIKLAVGGKGSAYIEHPKGSLIETGDPEWIDHEREYMKAIRKGWLARAKP
jgi:hypothetical protein